MKTQTPTKKLALMVSRESIRQAQELARHNGMTIDELFADLIWRRWEAQTAEIVEKHFQASGPEGPTARRAGSHEQGKELR